MSKLQGDAANIRFYARQPTSAVPLKSPCFSVYHYNQPCYSGYQHRPASLLHGKRKGSTESTFHPRTKQQITEARITSSMQQLTLDTALQGIVNIPVTTDRATDEGFFEDPNDFVFDDDDDDDLDLDLDKEDGKEEEEEGLDSSDAADSKNYPQYKLPDDVKNGIDKMMNGILPKEIYKSMNQACLALVPYVPTCNLTTKYNNTMIEEEEKRKSKEVNDAATFDEYDDGMTCDYHPQESQGEWREECMMY